MGKPTGFLEHGRELPQKIDPAERIKNNKEFVLNEEFGDKINTQASRCLRRSSGCIILKKLCISMRSGPFGDFKIVTSLNLERLFWRLRRLIVFVFIAVI